MGTDTNKHPGDSVDTWKILLAEDNAADVFLVRKAIESHNLPATLHVVSDGEKAVRYIDAADRDEVPCPELLVLDLNLPKVSGEEILAHLLRSRQCKEVPVVIISSASLPREPAHIDELRASHYFRKPSDYNQYMRLGELLRSVLEKLTSKAH